MQAKKPSTSFKFVWTCNNSHFHLGRRVPTVVRWVIAYMTKSSTFAPIMLPLQMNWRLFISTNNKVKIKLFCTSYHWIVPPAAARTSLWNRHDRFSPVDRFNLVQYKTHSPEAKQLCIVWSWLNVASYVQSFGSFSTGLFLPTSDIDLVILGVREIQSFYIGIKTFTFSSWRFLAVMNKRAAKFLASRFFQR